VTPVGLETEHAAAPLDVESAAPRLSWRFAVDSGVLRQDGYQIVVASDPSLLDAGRADVWDSGEVRSGAQHDVPYAGPPLSSTATSFWAVRAWTDGARAPGPWSAPARFETGLLRPSDWTARWIGRDDPDVVPRLGEQAPAPLLRTEFSLSRAVVRARLRIVGLGHHVAFLNGARVGDTVLDPPPSAFDETALYVTHDVSEALRPGSNALGVRLGRGFFAAPAAGAFLGLATAPWRHEPRLLLQLDVTHDDGSSTRVVSDGSWRMADGPLRDSAWEGELYDARLEHAGWTEVGFDASSWSPAPEQAAPSRTIAAAAMEPIRIAETIAPVAMTSPRAGVSVYDFGRTIAGWARIRTRGEAGTTFVLKYGETLLPDGTVALIAFGRDAAPVHVDAYTLSGRDDEQWEPSFARHGFRYVQVEFEALAPRVLEVEARVNHTAVASVGSFACGSDRLNRLHENQRSSLLANLWGFPTDTPWRDRMGWTADAWLMLDSAALNFDVQRLYAQWLRTFRESQGVDGSLPVIAPSVTIFGHTLVDDPSWSGTIVLTTWALYQHYGDVRVLADSYAAMARWIDRMSGIVAATGDVFRGISFGDWSAPGSEANGSVSLAPPEGPPLTATADLYQEARTLARIATLLGHAADAARFDAFAERVKRAFNATFLDRAAGLYRIEGAGGGYRQTSNLIALAYELVPDELADAVYANLVADVTARGAHLDTGAIGTKLLLPILTERGDVDLAYAVATQTTYPSWGSWLEHGATTSWETWSHTGPLHSQNHAFLGTFDDWLFTHLAGIRPAAPGYAALRIEPFVPAALEHAAATLDTPYGVVSSAWRRDEQFLTLTVELPPNTSAEIHVPAGAEGDDVITIAAAGSGGLRATARRPGRAVYAAGPGRHVIEVPTRSGAR
jgi:alpha-L-rhamnosidase